MNDLFTRVSKRISLVLISSVLLFSFATAQIIKGKVVDAKTNEPLIGATITFTKNNKPNNAFTGLDGSFIIKSSSIGLSDMIVYFIGYEQFKIDEIKNGNIGIIKLRLKADDLSTITVNSQKSKESDEYARVTEKNAATVQNTVSAKAIEISPDITLGNVMQRVSGVSVTRTSSGDGQYAIIRGMSQRYNYTSIGGVILPSPDDKSRSVPMDIFPADMIERVEVIKALSPSMEGSAIAGVTNLVMKNAPSKLVISGNIGTGVNSIFFNRSFSGFSKSGINFSAPSEMHPAGYIATPNDFSVKELNFKNVSLPVNTNAAVSIGDRLFHKKLGVLVAGSFSRQYRGSNTLFFDQIAISTDPTPNSVHLLSYQNRQYDLLQTRSGLNVKFDYSFSANHTINFYNVFVQLDENQHRSYNKVGINPTNAPGEIDYFDRVVFSRKNLYNSTLKGTDKLAKNLAIDWTLSYSIAKSATPDWIDFGKFKDSANATVIYASPATHNWNRSKDEDKAGYLNLTFSPSKSVELVAGGMYRAKDRNAFYQSYKLGVIAPGGLARQPYTDINSVQFGFYPAADGLGTLFDPQNYSGTENVGAGYIEGRISPNDKLKIVGGVRVEVTDQTYLSQQTDALPGKTGDIHYTDVLPSLNIKYELTASQNLRFSYFSGISRATLLELVPATSAGDFYSVGGNPYLKHTTSDNFDFRYENYLTKTDHIMAGVFYKNINNPIETAFYYTDSTHQNLVYGSNNPGSGATNYGVELVYAKFIHNWGISGNYTYTHSRVTTPKQVTPATTAGSVSTFPDQTRPLQGQADHIGNLSLLYKNSKAGFDAQLSFVYTGKRISIVNGYYNLDYWQRATSQLDFSAEEKFNHHISAFIKITNLLNNNIYYDLYTTNYSSTNKFIPNQSDPNKVLVQKDEFNQSFLAGLRFKF